MKLQTKFLIVYLVTVVFLTTGFGLFQRGVVLKSFLALEDRQARQDLDRTAAALNQSLANLSSTVVDWAPWDDTYLFISGENPKYAEDNLGAQTVMNLRVNLILFLDDSGKVFHGVYFDLDGQEFQPMPAGLVESILGNERLTHRSADQGAMQGLINTVSGPLLVAAHPILKNDFSGPPHGVLIMGRLINQTLVDELSQVTGLKVVVQAWDQTGGTEAEAKLMELLKDGDAVVQTTGADQLSASRLIRDLEGRPASVLTVKLFRETYGQGLATAATSFWWVLGLGLLLALLGWILLNRMVLARWTRLEREVQEIGHTEDFGRRLRVDSRDELGSFANNINQMMDSLQDARQRERVSENRFAQAFDHAALGMSLTDLNGRFIDVNPYFCLMVGYSKEELLTMQFNDITDPEDRHAGIEILRAILTGEREYAWFEKRYRHRNGTTVWAMVSAALIRDDKRKPLYFVAHMQDITQRKLAELEKQENQKQLQTIADNLPVLIAYVDADQRYRFVNKQHELWFARPREQMIGLRVSEVLSKAGYEIIRPKLEMALSGQAAFFEGLITTKDGPRLFFSRYIPHFNPDGTVAGYYVLAEDITERRKFEADLAESREQYELLAKNTADLVALSNERAEFTYVSPSYQNQLGYSEEELLGRPVTDMVHPDDLPPILEIIAHRYETLDSSPVTVEYRMRHKDGQYLWFETKGQILFNEEDQPQGAMYNTRNITERKLAEQALRESEALFSGFMKHLPTTAFIKDPEGRYIFANEAYRNILGVNPEDRLGKSDEELYSAEIASKLRANDLQILESSQSLERLETVIDSTGREHVQFTVKFPINRADGSTVVAGVGMDVTSQVQAEKELRDSEAKYRTIMESTAHSITITDVETGEFYEVNSGFVALSGYTREEAIGQTVFSLNLLAVPGERENFVETLQRDGEVIGIPVHYRIKSGVILDSIFSAKPILYNGRNCLVAVVQDVTALRKAEQSQDQLRNQLQRAQKMEAVGTLAGGIAHDFNNILQTISGYLEIMRLIETPHPKFQTYLSEIDSVTKRAARLVRQLLTFSRKMEPELKPTDINEVVLSTATILKHTIPRMITITTSLDPELSLVKADHNQLEQVLVNLATNARDAMPDGGELLIETAEMVMDEERQREHPMLGAERYVLLKVSDTGTGIGEDILKDIFTPFFTTKPLGQGTGLGLAMVYGIVQEHGGQILCDSRPGRGTVFSIYLPAFTGDEVEGQAADDLIPEELGGHENILLVDDEPGILEVTKDVLRASGYQVKTARSGEEALKIFNDDPEAIDLVILDLGMPGMGGFRCLKELIRLRPDLAVLVASGYSHEAQPGELLEYGAAGYIAKPYRFAELLKAMRDTLDIDLT